MRAVYFIRPVGMQGPVKIGCSHSPPGRQNTLETWSPFALEIFAQIEGGFFTEKRFHALFSHLHERREWFRWAPEIDAVTDAINAGTFDLASLPDPQHIAHGNSRKRTPEQCRRQSLSLRCTYMEKRTGYSPPVHTCLARDEISVARLEAYLKDPAKHGKPIDTPWAREKQAQLHGAAA